MDILNHVLSPIWFYCPSENKVLFFCLMIVPILPGLYCWLRILEPRLIREVGKKLIITWVILMGANLATLIFLVARGYPEFILVYTVGPFLLGFLFPLLMAMQLLWVFSFYIPIKYGVPIFLLIGLALVLLYFERRKKNSV